MNSNARITDVRIYSPEWMVCDVVRDRRVSILRYGKAQVMQAGEIDWLDWLFNAPEAAQQNFAVAPDGSTAEWPKLERSLSADELLDHAGRNVGPGWKRQPLRSEISRDELIEGCWSNLDMMRRVELQPGGNCIQRETGRGKPADVPGRFTWTFEDARRFTIERELPQPQHLSDSVLQIFLEQKLLDPERIPADRQIRSEQYSYDVKRFDGELMELLETRSNGLFINGPTPIWWRKAKRGRR